jgi:hypothetical protein
VLTSSGPPAPQRDTARIVLVVLGVVVVFALVALLAVVGLLAVGRSESPERSLAIDSAPRPTQPSPEAPRPGAPEPPSGLAPGPTGGPIRVLESGFSTGEGFDGATWASAGAVLRNDGTSAAFFVEVVVTFLNAAGDPVATETGYVNAIEPDAEAHLALDGVTLRGDAVDMEVAVVSSAEEFWSGRSLPVSVGGVTVDEFFGLTVNGTAANPSSTTVETAVLQCVVRQGDAIVGGASTLLDTMVAGARVAWDAITFGDWLQGDDADCSASVLE